MNVRNRIFAIVGALMLLGGSVTTTFAQAVPTASGNATVAVTADAAVNFLAVAISTAGFGTTAYSFTNRTVSGNLTVTATDTRGTEAGWNINLGATSFTSVTSPDVIPSTNLALDAGSVTASVGSINGVTTAPVSEVQSVGSASQIAAASATNGAGIYNIAIGGTLTIPGGTLVAVYTSTVTVSIASGP